MVTAKFKSMVTDQIKFFNTFQTLYEINSMPYELKQLLIQRLGHKGLEKNLIPGFLRSLANSIDRGQNPNFTLINKHMRHIGWDDIDLDYRTFELARNCLEAGGFVCQEYKPSKWYEEIIFSLQ